MSDAFDRWLEVRQDGSRVIHADMPGQDYTLCGFAIEGACMGDDDDSECVPVSRGKINCEKCCAMIEHAKAIPARFLAIGGARV